MPRLPWAATGGRPCEGSEGVPPSLPRGNGPGIPRPNRGRARPGRVQVRMGRGEQSEPR
jgi:hypothetical protein